MRAGKALKKTPLFLLRRGDQQDSTYETSEKV